MNPLPAGSMRRVTVDVYELLLGRDGPGAPSQPAGGSGSVVQRSAGRRVRLLLTLKQFARQSQPVDRDEPGWLAARGVASKCEWEALGRVPRQLEEADVIGVARLPSTESVARHLTQRVQQVRHDLTLVTQRENVRKCAAMTNSPRRLSATLPCYSARTGVTSPCASRGRSCNRVAHDRRMDTAVRWRLECPA